MQAIQALKLFDDQHNVSMEDMLHLRATGSALASQYQEMDLETPEWLMDKMDALNKAIEAQAEAELKRKLREIEAQEDALRTNSERRNDLASQKARIQKKLGIKAPKAA